MPIMKNLFFSFLFLAFFALLSLGCGQEESSSDVPEEPQPSVFLVGEFSLEWFADGAGLTVVHTAAPDKILYESTSPTSMVEAAIAQENVASGAGSFQFEDQVSQACAGHLLPSVREEEGQVIFEADFESCPGGFEFRFQAAADRQLQFDIALNQEAMDGGLNRVALYGKSDAEEGFYGFGNQYNILNLKGRVLPIWCQEQGHGRGLEPLTSVLSSLEGNAAGDWYTSYTCVPYFMTNQGRSFLIENTEYLTFELEDEDRWGVRVFTQRLRGHIFFGNNPLEIIETLTAFTGRMSPLPSWTQGGPIVRAHDGSEHVREAVDELLGAGVPLAAVWIEDWCGLRQTYLGSRIWWNWVTDQDRYPDWPELINELKDQGVRIVTYINPFLVDASEKENATRNLFEEAQENGFLVKDEEGEVLMIESGGFDAAMIDLTHEELRSWMKEIMKEQMELGVSGWMADFAEALPYNAVLSNGETGKTYHNEYPRAWAELNREAVQEADVEGDFMFFSRSGNAFSPGVSTLFWIGDQLCSWDEFDGIKTVVPALLSSGLSGYSLQHTDTGGYLSLSLPSLVFHRSKELFQRWLELNAFTVLLRMHASNEPEKNHQYNSDAETLEHFSRMSRVFASLAPYRAELMAEAQETGVPVVRHPLLHYTDDPQAWALTQQFMLGSELMVAPVIHEGAVEVELYLPAGRWVHVWTGEVFGNEEAGVTITVPAPIGEPAVFFVEGSTWGNTWVETLSEEGLLSEATE